MKVGTRLVVECVVGDCTTVTNTLLFIISVTLVFHLESTLREEPDPLHFSVSRDSGSVHAVVVRLRSDVLKVPVLKPPTKERTDLHPHEFRMVKILGKSPECPPHYFRFGTRLHD